MPFDKVMPYPSYKKLIEKQRRTGIIHVRCDCGEPAIAWSIGSPACKRCLELDERRMKDNNRQAVINARATANLSST